MIVYTVTALILYTGCSKSYATCGLRARNYETTIHRDNHLVLKGLKNSGMHIVSKGPQEWTVQWFKYAGFFKKILLRSLQQFWL